MDVAALVGQATRAPSTRSKSSGNQERPGAQSTPSINGDVSNFSWCTVSEGLLKPLKSICKRNETLIPAAYHYLRTDLKRRSVVVRYRSFLCIDVLFMRSKSMRGLVCGNLQDIVQVFHFSTQTMRSSDTSAVVRSKEVSFQRKVKESLEIWHLSFGHSYPSLQSTIQYMTTTLNVVMPNLLASALQHANEEEQRLANKAQSHLSEAWRVLCVELRASTTGQIGLLSPKRATEVSGTVENHTRGGLLDRTERLLREIDECFAILFPSVIEADHAITECRNPDKVGQPLSTVVDRQMAVGKRNFSLTLSDSEGEFSEGEDPEQPDSKNWEMMNKKPKASVEQNNVPKNDEMLDLVADDDVLSSDGSEVGWIDDDDGDCYGEEEFHPPVGSTGARLTSDRDDDEEVFDSAGQLKTGGVPYALKISIGIGERGSVTDYEGQRTVLHHIQGVCTQLIKGVLPKLNEWKTALERAKEFLPANDGDTSKEILHLYVQCLTPAQQLCLHGQSVAAACDLLRELSERIRHAVHVKCAKLLSTEASRSQPSI